MGERVCAWCGASLAGKRSDAKWCGEKCGKAAMRKRAQAPILEYTHICVVCGVAFHPKKKDRTKCCGIKCGHEWSGFKVAMKKYGGRVRVRKPMLGSAEKQARLAAKAVRIAASRVRSKAENTKKYHKLRADPEKYAAHLDRWHIWRRENPDFALACFRKKKRTRAAKLHMQEALQAIPALMAMIEDATKETTK